MLRPISFSRKKRRPARNALGNPARLRLQRWFRSRQLRLRPRQLRPAGRLQPVVQGPRNRYENEPPCPNSSPFCPFTLPNLARIPLWDLTNRLRRGGLFPPVPEILPSKNNVTRFR